MAFELPPLPYPEDALEPSIDSRTMSIHHDKHHAGYTNNLNAALADHPDFAAKSIEDLLGDLEALPESIRTAVRNNGGGYANHSLFWTIMGPNGGGAPSGDLAKAIDDAFGSFDGLQGSVQQSCRHALRFRLGLALCEWRRQAGCWFNPEPGHPVHGRRYADPGPGCLGTCLLSELPEPPPGLYQCLVECCRLGRSRRELRRREISARCDNE